MTRLAALAVEASAGEAEAEQDRACAVCPAVVRDLHDRLPFLSRHVTSRKFGVERLAPMVGRRRNGFRSPAFSAVFADCTIAAKRTSIHNRKPKRRSGLLDRESPANADHQPAPPARTIWISPSASLEATGPRRRLPRRRPAGRAADRLALQRLAHAGARRTAPAGQAGASSDGRRTTAIRWPSIPPAPSRPQPTFPAPRRTGSPRSILRDRAARRLDDTVTASGLSRRYSTDRTNGTKIAKSTGGRPIGSRRAPGQSWLFRAAHEGPEALAESYDYRLMLEPAALLAPGFRLDEAQASALRLGMEAQLASPESSFDVREFQRLDLEFHGMIARGSSNRFVGQALADHLEAAAPAGRAAWRERVSAKAVDARTSRHTRPARGAGSSRRRRT